MFMVILLVNITYGDAMGYMLCTKKVCVNITYSAFDCRDLVKNLVSLGQKQRCVIEVDDSINVPFASLVI